MKRKVRRLKRLKKTCSLVFMDICYYQFSFNYAFISCDFYKW